MIVLVVDNTLTITNIMKAIKDNQMQAILYSYLAGLFDGEGTIRINAGRNIKSYTNTRYSPAISIGMSDEKVIKLISKTFKGKVNINRECVLNRKTMYRWGTSGRNRVSEILKILLPYLKVKKPQALLVIKFCERGKWKRKKNTNCLKCKDKKIIQGYGLCQNCYMQERRANRLNEWKQNKQIKTLPIKELQWREELYKKVKKLNAIGAAATTKQEHTREGEVIV